VISVSLAVNVLSLWNSRLYVFFETFSGLYVMNYDSKLSGLLRKGLWF
jgi:hypothetical protein